MIIRQYIGIFLQVVILPVYVLSKHSPPTHPPSFPSSLHFGSTVYMYNCMTTVQILFNHIAMVMVGGSV